MIVNVAGWVFVVTALIGLLIGLKEARGTELMLVLIQCAFVGGVGVGLLRRRNWGRWLALGMTLLTWTLGSLYLLYVAVKTWRLLLLLLAAAPGYGIGVLVAVALIVAYVVMCFKLFNYLIEEEAKEEFETPPSESHAVLKSTGAYIAFVVLLAVLDPSRSAFSQFGRSSHANSEFLDAMDRAAREREQRRVAPPPPPPQMSREQQEQLREDRRRERNEAKMARAAAAEEQQQQQLERDQARAEAQDEARARAQSDASNRLAAREEYNRGTRALYERQRSDPSYTSAQRQADLEELNRTYEEKLGITPRHEIKTREERPTSKILKCRDSSGSISYTQGYCPPGTTPVETPTPE